MNSGMRIVVGVDGSDGGRRALRWAVAEAGARGGTVQAVGAWRWDALDPRTHAPVKPEQERRRTEDILAREVDSIGEGAGVTIASEAVEGRAAEVLTAVACDADLLVLGSHGHGSVRHTVLGSVSEECIRRAGCPVVVIPVPRVAPGRGAEPAVRPGTARP